MKCYKSKVKLGEHLFSFKIISPRDHRFNTESVIHLTIQETCNTLSFADYKNRNFKNAKFQVKLPSSCSNTPLWSLHFVVIYFEHLVISTDSVKGEHLDLLPFSFVKEFDILMIQANHRFLPQATSQSF